MALSVKSYYERENNPKPEIRRLSIDQGLSTNFMIFSERLSQVYGGLKDVELFWKGESQTASKLCVCVYVCVCVMLEI